MEEILDKIAHPDYVALIRKYTELEQFQTANGTSIDLSKPDALYALTTAQLQEHFGLDVQLSKHHLCPRLANRLDYVLWIHALARSTREEDDAAQPKKQLCGLDVGVGASCIYPLLMCSIDERITMYGTEIADDSESLAKTNVSRNSELADRIHVVRRGPSDLFFSWEESPTFDFSLCNPPFYSSAEDLEASRVAKSEDPASPLLASDHELFTPGGESAYTMRMLRESADLNNTHTWYSTMFGKKQTLTDFVEAIRERGISNYALHEISHGKTRRWCAAWNYGRARARHNLSRLYSSHLRHLNPHPTRLPAASVAGTTSLADISTTLQELHPGVESSQLDDSITVTVRGNTWSRAARRKRQKLDGASGQSFEPASMFSIFIKDSVATVDWIVGTDFVLFESFVGMLKRRIDAISQK